MFLTEWIQNLREWIRTKLGTWEDFLWCLGIVIGLLIAPFYLLYLLIKEILLPERSDKVKHNE